jgi:hypothetical protein
VRVQVRWDKGGTEGYEPHQLGTGFAVYIRECQMFKEYNLLVIGDDM